MNSPEPSAVAKDATAPANGAASPGSVALQPLRQFIAGMTQLVGRSTDEPTLLREGRALLATLIANDTWLPAACAVARSDRYAQYLLHCDPLERFSVVSFVWGPGQRTPVHDHTVWGLVGVLRGCEACEEYALDSTGQPVPALQTHQMQRHAIEAVSPTVGDWHRVSNALTDQASISIHVYGGNIGAIRRHRLDDAGRVVEFVSGYDNPQTPNLWDRSR